MVIKHKHQLLGTSRAIQTDHWSTVRLLLAEDGVGITVTDVVLGPGSDAVYCYKHHTEVCYCLEGRAVVVDFETGETHQIEPGTLWVARKQQRFRFTATERTRLITVFMPALVGPEVNDADGSFPLLTPAT
jgi:L-ectoine synthase